MDETLKKTRDLFREIADIIDEIEILDEKQKSGHDVTKDSESAMGRLVIKTMMLSSLEE